MRFRFAAGTVTVTHPDPARLIADVEARLRTRQGFALATINLDHLAKLQHCSDFLEAYQAQDMVVADGHPVVWLSQLAGRPVSLLPGSDLVVPLAVCAARAGAPVALFGSNAPTLERAAQYLRSQIDGVDVVAAIAPPMGFDPDSPAAEAAVANLAKSGARLVFVALGAPKQERFAAMGRRIAPQLGFVSVGAGIDFIGGAQRRAPHILRRMALEWLWRMLSDPVRLIPRYARCVQVLPRHVIDAVAARRVGP